jgi:uncharacterized membrane protein YgdD (TMEM256/DUF423 family)
MQNASRRWLLVGALLGGAAVASGAFGAHGLKAHFASDGVLSEADQQQMANWETAARYQMYHGLAVVAVAVLGNRRGRLLLDAAAVSFTIGTLVFSGCLYVLVLTGQRWLGAVVPVGGTLLILGWLCLAIAAVGQRADESVF